MTDPGVGLLLAKLLDGARKSLLRFLGAAAKSVVDKTIADLQIGFGKYLEDSYAKCRFVKTLLSPDKPLEVNNIYVNVVLECQDEVIDDIDLIERLSTYRAVVITGLAGSGKSMLMRYLTIRRFKNSHDTIPLFVELREINSFTTKDLLAFIYHSCMSADNRVTFDQFTLALKAGVFLFILDGFDELEHSFRRDIERQILEISQKYSKLSIIVSSRPDERFSSWSTFYVFKVKELTKKQSVELINKIDYDSGVKKRFIREIERRLYQTHRTFLSSPLLATIMLLTYEQFADIPDKMHIFYNLAFDTLSRRHDALKAQFKRKTLSKLAIDDFKSCFATFCAMSYLNTKHSFEQKELEQYIKDALEYGKYKASAADFLSDLKECLCMLQHDGLNIVFVHRSFQEYFVAVFAAAYHGANIKDLLDRLSFRYNDAVMPMLFEMARDKVEQEWVLPTTTSYLKMIRENNESGEFLRNLTLFTSGFSFVKNDGTLRLVGMGIAQGGMNYLFDTLNRLYPGYLPRTFNRLWEMGQQIAKTLPRYAQSGDEIISGYLSKLKEQARDDAEDADADAEDEHAFTGVHLQLEGNSRWFPRGGAEGLSRELELGLEKIDKEVSQRTKKRGAMMSEFFKPATPPRKPPSRTREPARKAGKARSEKKKR